MPTSQRDADTVANFYQLAWDTENGHAPANAVFSFLFRQLDPNCEEFDYPLSDEVSKALGVFYEYLATTYASATEYLTFVTLMFFKSNPRNLWDADDIDAVQQRVAFPTTLRLTTRRTTKDVTTASSSSSSSADQPSLSDRGAAAESLASSAFGARFVAMDGEIPVIRTSSSASSSASSSSSSSSSACAKPAPVANALDEKTAITVRKCMMIHL